VLSYEDKVQEKNREKKKVKIEKIKDLVVGEMKMMK